MPRIYIHQPYPYYSTLMETLKDPFKGSLKGTLKEGALNYHQQ